MSFVKCFDVVQMVVDEASNQFAPLWKVNEEKLNELKEKCADVDSMILDFGGEGIEVEVDDIKLTISITVSCCDGVIVEGGIVFLRVVNDALSVGFTKSKDGEGVDVTRVFPGIWDKV